MNFDFETLKEKGLELIRQKKSRDIIILAVLIVVLLWLFIPIIFHGKKIFKNLKVVECEKCREEAVKEVEVGKIKKCECGKCGAPVSYVYKCLECDYEFPLTRLRKEDITGIEKMSKKQYRQYRINESKCPNCGSIFTDPKLPPRKKEGKK